jgi:spore coat protein U-like protein
MNKYSHITRNVVSLAVLALAIAGTGSAVAAEDTAQATGTVISPIAITKTADLVFGSFASGAGGGTVTISTAGARGKSGDVFLAGTAGGAAKFDVSGEGGLTYSIALATTPLTRENGSETMNFTVSSDITSGTLAGTGASGAQSFFVGGVLTVGAAQVPGTYAGTVKATVAYN